MKPFYLAGYIVCQSIYRIFFRLSAKGRKNIPESGPFIAASNHLAFSDPVIIASILKKEISFLARAELFEIFLLKNLIKKLNAFPIRRGRADVASIKTCLHILQENKMPLLIFPEGTRIKNGKLGTPKRGIGFIALQTKVPILPVYIENSNRLGACALFRRRLKIRIGRPLDYVEYKHFFADSKSYLEFARWIMSKIHILKEEEKRAKS